MRLFLSLGLCGLMVSISGCTQDTSENVEEAVNAAGKAASSAADDAADAAANAVDAAKDAASAAKEKLGEGMEALVEKANAAVEGIEGGPEALKNVTRFFSSAKESLSNVTDSATAESARDKLNELGGALDGIKEAMGKLPAEAKTVLVSIVEKGKATLNEIGDRIMATPEVKDVLKPKFDEIMEELSGLTS